MNWRTGSCRSFLKKSLIPRAILEIMTKRALDPIRGRRIVGTMTMSMIGTGTIMIVIMIAIAPCSKCISREDDTPRSSLSHHRNRDRSSHRDREYQSSYEVP